MNRWMRNALAGVWLAALTLAAGEAAAQQIVWRMATS